MSLMPPILAGGSLPLAPPRKPIYICIYIKLNHCAVFLKLTQQCKSTIIKKLKIKKVLCLCKKEEKERKAGALPESMMKRVACE